MINEKRIRLPKGGTETAGPVLYWMSRDQRANDNWALLFAQKLAIEGKKDLVAVFSLVPEFLDATLRQYDFMLGGLGEIEKELKKNNIPFYILLGDPAIKIPKFVNEIGASNLVSDFDPLKIKRKWKNEVANKVNIPLHIILFRAFMHRKSRNLVLIQYVRKFIKTFRNF